MRLARHVAVLWRFRVITATGLCLAVILATLASYQVVYDGGLSIRSRGTSTYTSRSNVLVTQPGFPEGRVVLPTSAPGGSPTEKPEVDPNRLEFADPSRFMALADLYTKLIVSDEVRGRIPGRPSASRLTASPLPAVSGAPILPIIQLDATAGTAAGSRALNIQAVRALREVLRERQSRNDISPAKRVEISVINAPSSGKLKAGPSHTASILALILCLIGTVAFTHLLASLRAKDADVDFDNLVFPWAMGEGEGEAKGEDSDEDSRQFAARGKRQPAGVSNRRQAP
jgi:hypothetical protein